MDYNDETKWLDVGMMEIPKGVDVSSYQAGLNSICGLNPFGKPNILLTWMPAMENYYRVYSEWDEAGFGTKTILRCQFRSDTIFHNNIPIDIPPPRWALKEYIHPSQYEDDMTRWAKKQDGQQVLQREIRPPHPADGYYKPKIRVGKHNGFCCKEKQRFGLTCWGDYREPDESYLIWLKNAYKERNENENQNPNEPLSEETMRRAALEAANRIKAKEEEVSTKTSAYITENLDTLLAHFTGDKSFLEKKKDFSFPTSDGGIILPL